MWEYSTVPLPPFNPISNFVPADRRCRFNLPCINWESLRIHAVQHALLAIVGVVNVGVVNPHNKPYFLVQHN